MSVKKKLKRQNNFVPVVERINVRNNERRKSFLGKNLIGKYVARDLQIIKINTVDDLNNYAGFLINNKYILAYVHYHRMFCGR